MKNLILVLAGCLAGFLLGSKGQKIISNASSALSDLAGIATANCASAKDAQDAANSASAQEEE